MTVMRSLPLLLGCVLLLGTPACRGQAGVIKHMRNVADVNVKPNADDVVVVFLRPSGMAYDFQASVFDLGDAQTENLVGILAAKMKLAYRTTPGTHRFMILGGNAEFMDANLQAGKVYYAVAMPGPGVGKAWFVLRPVHAADRGELAGWGAQTSWVETTEGSFRWAEDNAPSIKAKRAKYFPPWTQRTPAQRDALAPEDGQ
jgi:hypothetical protein